MYLRWDLLEGGMPADITSLRLYRDGTGYAGEARCALPLPLPNESVHAIVLQHVTAADAGLLLAETEYRHEVEVTIEPFKGLLMGLFFLSVGAGVDPKAILDNPVWVPLSAIGLFGLKALVVSVIFRLGGLSWGRALEGGLLLGQGGEFAFVVVGAATATGLISGPLGQFILLVVGLSLFMTPALARLGQAVRERLERDDPSLPDDEAAPSHLRHQVVIAGFGRVGQLTAEVLTRHGVPYVAVEQDANRVAHFRNLGLPVYYGNAARPELLHRMQAEHAAMIVVTTDKGLCGGLNTNVLRAVTNELKALQGKGQDAQVVAIGNKGLGFMNRIGAKVVSSVTGLGDTPHLEKLIGPVKVLLDAYTEGRINAVYLCYTRFINTMKQEAVTEQLLPLNAGTLQDGAGGRDWDYIYEPDAPAVIDELLLRYVEAQVYQAVAENMASEQSARMVAMKAATDNAGSVIGELKLVYNKTRQAAITKELSEIVAGAAAV